MLDNQIIKTLLAKISRVLLFVSSQTISAKIQIIMLKIQAN